MYDSDLPADSWMIDTFSRCWFDEGLVRAAGGISRFAQGVKVTLAKPLLASILIGRLFLEFLVRTNLQTRVTGQEEPPGLDYCCQYYSTLFYIYII